MDPVSRRDKLARILVVDDDSHRRLAMRRLLSGAGYAVFEAPSGHDALRQIKAKRPGLVLLDAVLPDLGGLEVCRRIKDTAGQDSVPAVLLFGAHVDSEGQAEGLEAGADGYIVRPVSDRELVARVEALLRLGQVEKDLRERTYQLRERVKELNCLYGISHLVEQPGITLDEILAGTVELLPAALRHPEVAYARIVLDGSEYCTRNYRESPWQSAQALNVSGVPAGVIQVGYLERPAHGNTGPFSEGETNLIRAIAARMGRIVERLQAQERLRTSEERYALAQRVANIGSWDWDIRTGALHWSEQIEPMFGFLRGEFGATYDDFLDCIHPRDRQRVVEAVAACIEHGEDYALEHRIVWPDGTIRWVSETGDVIRDGEAKAIRMLGVVQDVTRHKEVESALRRAVESAEVARLEEEARRQEAERRRQIAESLGDVLTVLNSNRSLDQVLDFIAVQARQLLGPQAAVIYRVEDGTGTLAIQAARGLVVTYVSGAQIPLGRSALEQAMASRMPVVVPDAPPAGTGQAETHQEALGDPWSRVYRAMLAVPIVVQNAIYGALLLYYTRPRAFSEEEVELATLFGDQIALALENAWLREKVQQAAATAERDRLARDLHDAVAQTLFSVSLIGEAIPRVWERDPKEGRRGLEELRRLTRGAAAEMRTLLVELRPAFLIEKPLGELLRHLSEAVTGQTRIPVVLCVEGDSLLPADVQIALYRIAQESLNNVARHAFPTRAWVDVECRPDRASLSVRDDGRGFHLEDVLPDRVGMGIMRERAEGIGATFRIESRPGEGTQVTVQWRAGAA